jgi:hypothetical protein
MPKVLMEMSMSVDGYVVGPDVSTPQRHQETRTPCCPAIKKAALLQVLHGLQAPQSGGGQT